MLTEAQSSRLERRAKSLLQKKSISLAKEIPLFLDGDLNFVLRRNILLTEKKSSWVAPERKA